MNTKVFLAFVVLKTIVESIIHCEGIPLGFSRCLWSSASFPVIGSVTVNREK
jgi:hypothetical protein